MSSPSGWDVEIHILVSSHTKSNIPEYGQGIFPDTPGHIPVSTPNFIFASMDHLSPFVDYDKGRCPSMKVRD